MNSDFIIPNKNFLGTLIFVIKKCPFRISLYKLFEEKLYRLKVLLKLGSLRSFKNYSETYGIPLFRTKNVNDKNTITLIKGRKPDVIYCISFAQKLNRSILDIPKFGCVNFHPSLLPSYRGLFPYFWVMANNEKWTGVSFHLMEEDWDAGKLIMQEKLKIAKDESMQHLFFRCAILAGKMLLNLQDKLEKNEIELHKQETDGSSYYGWPNKDGYKKFKKNKKRIFKFKELWASI
jgi:methionyl-tRNA formyltransferase